MRKVIAGRYYCCFCFLRLGSAGRAALVAEREIAVSNYPFPPEEPSLHHDPRPAAVIAEYEVVLKQYNAVRKKGCRHAPLIGKNTRKCLCLQNYRWMGEAIVDKDWKRRTQKMREGWSEVPPSSEAFRWKPAEFLDEIEVQPDCLRHVMTALYSHWGGTAKVGWFSRMGHICTLETAMKIQRDGYIKAQASETHKTVACFFFDFSDLVSIEKGVRSMRKHVKHAPANTRWGIYVQKEPFETKQVKLQSIWGACFVRASLKNVPSKHFDYFVAPPHMPYHAFVVGQFWGSPARQWAAFSNHKAELRSATAERKHYLELDFNPFGNIRLDVVLPALSARDGRMRPRRAAKTSEEYKKAVSRLKKAWGVIFDLKEEYETAVSKLQNFEGQIGQFSRGVEKLKGHNEKGIGAGQRHLDAWLNEPPRPVGGPPVSADPPAGEVPPPAAFDPASGDSDPDQDLCYDDEAAHPESPDVLLDEAGTPENSRLLTPETPSRLLDKAVPPEIPGRLLDKTTPHHEIPGRLLDKTMPHHENPGLLDKAAPPESHGRILDQAPPPENRGLTPTPAAAGSQAENPGRILDQAAHPENPGLTHPPAAAGSQTENPGRTLDQAAPPENPGLTPTPAAAGSPTQTEAERKKIRKAVYDKARAPKRNEMQAARRRRKAAGLPPPPKPTAQERVEKKEESKRKRAARDKARAPGKVIATREKRALKKKAKLGSI
jgi:hypothetical protein